MPEPIRVTKGGTIIPEWGNEEREDAEKIRINYRFLSFAEQQELLDPNELGRSFAYESRILSRMIEGIENLQIEQDGKIADIKNGAALVATPGLDALAMEMWLRFRNMTAVDKKK